MKNLIFLILLFSFGKLVAQENIEIKIKEWAVNGTMQPALVVDIPQTNAKDALKLWKETLVPKTFIDKLKKMPKMEKEENNKWVMRGIIIDNICPDTLDVYTRIEEMESKITFVALFDNNGSFMGKDTEAKETKKVKNYVRKFAVQAYKQGVQEELDDLKKEAEKMQKQYSNIENSNKKIERDNLETNTLLERLNTELSADKTAYKNGGTLVDGELTNPLSAEGKEQLGDAIKDKEKEIKKAKKTINKNSINTDKNKAKQQELTTLINETNTKIEAVEAKLANIK